MSHFGNFHISNFLLLFLYILWWSVINDLWCYYWKTKIMTCWRLRWWLAFFSTTITTAKSLQSCPTLCDPIDGSPPGSPVPGILQARTLEWVAISFSNAWKWKGKVKSLSCVWLFATPWTAAYQAPPPMGFSRQEYWSGSPVPSPTHPYFSNTNTHTFSSRLALLFL